MCEKRRDGQFGRRNRKFTQGGSEIKSVKCSKHTATYFLIGALVIINLAMKEFAMLTNFKVLL